MNVRNFSYNLVYPLTLCADDSNKSTINNHPYYA